MTFASCPEGSECVAVLLSVFRPNTFLREQVLSVSSQRNACIHLLIRIDGFEESTHEIDELLMDFPKKEIYRGIHVGSKRSYLELLSLALKYKFNFIAFCDQDDFWYEDKIAMGLNTLKSRKSIQVYASLQDLDIKGKLKQAKSLRLNELPYYQNQVRGCSLIIRRRIAELLIEMDSANIIQYDFALFVLAHELNTIYIDNQPGMTYRIHNNNEIGIPSAWSRLLRIHKVVKREQVSTIQLQANEVYRLLERRELGIRKELETVALSSEGNSMFFSRLKLVINLGQIRSKKSEDIFFKILILLNRVP